MLDLIPFLEFKYKDNRRVLQILEDPPITALIFIIILHSV